MIEFSHEYFEDEVRDGFYVNGLMKKCWAAQIEVLSDIAYVCEKYKVAFKKVNDEKYLTKDTFGIFSEQCKIKNKALETQWLGEIITRRNGNK